LVREARSGRELFRLPLHAASLRRLPRGTGRPVLLLPGLGATDVSLLALGRFLRRLGHDARPLGLGRITADVAGTVPLVIERAHHVAGGDTVALVGQSLGGVLAREAVRQQPHLVRRLITFGSPVVGGPEYTATRNRYTAAERDEIHRRIEERSQIPLPVPITAIWSANDGIVSTAASIDRRHAAVEHVEVTSSHLGMGFDPDVWRVVAERLALDGSRSDR
ncbi:MAG: esterase/lipase family protein, partial [Ilumatobacteraceae bacterium]